MLFQSEQTVLRFEEIEAKITYFVNDWIRILRSILDVLGSCQNQQSIDQVQLLNHGQSNSLAFLIVDYFDNFVELFEKVVTCFHTHEPETFKSQLYLVVHHERFLWTYLSFEQTHNGLNTNHNRLFCPNVKVNLCEFKWGQIIFESPIFVPFFGILRLLLRRRLLPFWFRNQRRLVNADDLSKRYDNFVDNSRKVHI